MTILNSLNLNEFAPYQANYIKLVTEHNIVNALIRQESEIMHFFKEIPVFKQEFQYAPNKWTIKDILLHLIDSERIFAYRALRIARNDKTILPGFEENDYVIAANANEKDFESLLEEYRCVRKSTILLFKNIESKLLLNIGNTSGYDVSVRGLGYCILGHELHHKNVIIQKYL